MENKFQINPSINNLEYLSNINKNNSSNNIQYNKINTNNTQTNQYYSKKKNPKEMTIEELEEYIQKNRAKMSNKNFESRSLNTSFTCNYNFGISEKIDKDNQNTFSVKRNNNNTKHFMTQNEKDDLKLNLNNSKENGNNEIKNNNTVSSLLQGVITSTPFIKNEQSSRTNTINNENDNYNDKQNNINNYNNIYDNNKVNNYEDKIYNNSLPLNINMNVPSPTFKNISNTLTYSLQKNDNESEINISKINNNNNIQNNNSEINNINNNTINFSQQKNYNQFDDIYNYKNKEINSNSNSTVSYIKSLQNKIKILNEENELLKKNSKNNNINNDIIKEIEMYKNKVLILEQDKLKYLEKFKMEKNNYETIILELKQNNETLKKLLEEKDKEINNITNKFEIERNEFLETMKSLREIIIQKENEKNILNLKNQNIMIKPNLQSNKEENNKKNNNLSQLNIISKKKPNYLFNNQNKNNTHNNNLKKQKTTNGFKKSDSINHRTKNKNSNNLSYINDNKNIKKIKNKTPNKIIKKSKSKPINTINTTNNGNDIKKINIKNNLNNNYTYENNNMNINYNFDTNNINQIDNANYNKYQNINLNLNNIPNLSELNSIRSDFSENIYKLNYEQENNKNNLKKINEVIFYLERSIPELSRDYQNLLNKINSNLFPNDNEKMINNLKSLGNEIENNKNQLNELKLKQQELLKNILEN